MITYFLANQACPGPTQVDGLTLKKERNKTYWGFLYRKLGFVGSLSNLRFTDADSVYLLRQTLKTQGLRASTAFRIEENGRVLYDGFIDYLTYSDDGLSFSVGLKDDLAVADLSAQATTVFNLSATKSIRLHTRRLGGVPGLIADPGTLIIQRSESSAVPITHSIPLTRRVENDETVSGTLSPVVTPLASDRCYFNSTTQIQTVTLSGTVIVTPRASVPLNATLRALPTFPDDATKAIQIATLAIGPATTQQTIAVNAQVPVNPGQSLKIEWIGDVNAATWSFTYSTKMQIFLSDESPVAPSTAYGLPLLDVMKDLIRRSSTNQLTLVSSFLSTDPDGQLFLASGEGVRGLQTSLNISLQQLFVNLSNLFNLSMWVDGSFVRLEKRSSRQGRRTQLTDLLSRTETNALDYVYNSVTVGFKTWQADDAALSGVDPNGLRTYSTGVSNQRSGLDLTCEFIGTSTVIEQQRRTQFDPQTNSSSKALPLDSNLFLIATTNGTKAETIARSGTITGVYDPATLYNLRLTPGRSLRNHLPDLLGSVPLTPQSVLGSDTLQSVYDGELIVERTPLPTSLGTRIPATVPKLVQIVCPMNMDEYADLGDDIDYTYLNEAHSGELLSAEWRLSLTGQLVSLTLLER